MPFVALFVAHAPDADPEKHRAVIDTGSYRLHVAVVRDHNQAVGPGVGVSVARGDPRSMALALQAMAKAGWPVGVTR